MDGKRGINRFQRDRIIRNAINEINQSAKLISSPPPLIWCYVMRSKMLFNAWRFFDVLTVSFRVVGRFWIGEISFTSLQFFEFLADSFWTVPPSSPLLTTYLLLTYYLLTTYLLLTYYLLTTYYLLSTYLLLLLTAYHLLLLLTAYYLLTTTTYCLLLTTGNTDTATHLLLTCYLLTATFYYYSLTTYLLLAYCYFLLLLLATIFPLPKLRWSCFVYRWVASQWLVNDYWLVRRELDSTNVLDQLARIWLKLIGSLIRSVQNVDPCF